MKGNHREREGRKISSEDRGCSTRKTIRKRAIEGCSDPEKIGGDRVLAWTTTCDPRVISWAVRRGVLRDHEGLRA